jgi:hypothetical protein
LYITIEVKKRRVKSENRWHVISKNKVVKTMEVY